MRHPSHVSFEGLRGRWIGRLLFSLLTISGLTQSTTGAKTAVGDPDSQTSPSVSLASAAVPRPVSGDLDGDDKSDVTIYRPSTGRWYSLKSTSGFTTNSSTQFGLPGDVPVAGDYDGDGQADLAVYRPAVGMWYVLNSSTNASTSFQWGLPGDLPEPGDYDGDGKMDLGVYRPSTGVWFISTSASRYNPATPITVGLGLATDIPVPADYDGDGKTDVAVYRPSTGMWYVRRSNLGTSLIFQWGLSGDVPVPGDYDGDGLSDLAVYRPASGVWYIRQSSTNLTTSVSFQWGLIGDIAAPADYDGDGKADLAVFRPAMGTWYMRPSTTAFVTSQTYQWGLPGDIPAANATIAHAVAAARGKATVSTLANLSRSSDLDGDGRADITVYRPSSSTWFTLRSSSNYAASATFQLGLSGDVAVSGDYDGDGTADLAVYRPSTGMWDILPSRTKFTTSVSFQWGLNGDVPVPGDYDGDGKADLAVLRPANGVWYVRLSGTGYATSLSFQWGLAGDIGAPGDFDGDGVSDLAVYRPSTGHWFIRLSSTNYVSFSTFQWGLPGDVPVSGDFDGDGRTDLVVYRPSTGEWFIRRSSTNYLTSTMRQWGIDGDIPVPGDFDGDGKTDLALFRPSTGGWLLLTSATNFTGSASLLWGLTGDAPTLQRPTTRPTHAKLVVEVPGQNATLTQPFVMSGWSADPDSTMGTGIDSVSVWASPADSGPATFVGTATYGAARPDVGSSLGNSRFINTGFSLTVTSPNLPSADTYDFTVYGHSTVTGGYAVAHIVRVKAAQIRTVVPSTGPSGTLVQITGTNFTPTSMVTFDGIPAKTVYLTETSVAAFVPFALASGTISPLDAKIVVVAVDGRPGSPFSITALPASPGPPGQVLSDTIDVISRDFKANEEDLRNFLAESAAATTDPDAILYFNALANLISPTQTLLSTVATRLPGTSNADVLRALDRAILANSASVMASSAVVGAQNVAVGDDCLLNGNDWLARRLALVKSQAVLSAINDSVNAICDAGQKVPLLAGEAAIVCAIPKVSLTVASLTKNLQISRYGLIKRFEIGDPLRDRVDDQRVRIETYQSKPRVLTATIQTQRQSNVLTWVNGIIEIGESVLSVGTIDSGSLGVVTEQAAKEVEVWLKVLSLLGKKGDQLDVGQTAPICPRAMSFDHLEPTSNVLFGQRVDQCAPDIALGMISPTGQLRAATPLPQPLSCTYALKHDEIVEAKEGPIQFGVNLFTPALEPLPNSLNFAGREGGQNPSSETFTIRAFAAVDPSGGVSADPDLEWTLSTLSGTLNSSHVQPSSTGGTLRDGVVSVAVDTTGLAAGEYDAKLRIEARDLNNSPQTIPVHLTVKPNTEELFTGTWSGTYSYGSMSAVLQQIGSVVSGQITDAVGCLWGVSGSASGSQLSLPSWALLSNPAPSVCIGGTARMSGTLASSHTTITGTGTTVLAGGSTHPWTFTLRIQRALDTVSSLTVLSQTR